MHGGSVSDRDALCRFTCLYAQKGVSKRKNVGFINRVYIFVYVCRSSYAFVTLLRHHFSQ